MSLACEVPASYYTHTVLESLCDTIPSFFHRS